MRNYFGSRCARTYAAIATVMYLTGCATPYQPMSFGGGFAETQLDENVFRVEVRGNGFTGRERVQDFALLRGARTYNCERVHLLRDCGFSELGKD